MTENTVLPLINTAFEPGNARKAAESFADRDFREIAIAEFYYFTGQAQKCSNLVEIYIMSSRLELKLSACMLYVYSNLTLGNAKASERGLEIIRECLRKRWKLPLLREIQHTVYLQDIWEQFFYISLQRNCRI